MAKRKPNKRVQKKQQTKKQQEILSAKYSPKEIKNLGSKTREKETKRIARNEKRKADRAESKKFLQDQGLDTKFINKYRLNNRQAKSFDSRELLKLKKQNALEKSGVNFTQSDLKLGWVKLQEKYPSLIIPDNAWKHPPKKAKETAKNAGFPYWLYVGAAAAGNDGFEPINFDSFTVSDFETHINEIINFAAMHPDGSGKMHCVYQVRISKDKDLLNHAAQVFYDRGYNLSAETMKLDNKSYSVLCLTNKWTKREFLRLILTCLSQMKNEHVSPFMDEMRRYCRLNGVDWLKNIT